MILKKCLHTDRPTDIWPYRSDLPWLRKQAGSKPGRAHLTLHLQFLTTNSGGATTQPICLFLAFVGRK